jgi:hypothetical protein
MEGFIQGNTHFPLAAFEKYLSIYKQTMAFFV